MLLRGLRVNTEQPTSPYAWLAGVGGSASLIGAVGVAASHSGAPWALPPLLLVGVVLVGALLLPRPIAARGGMLAAVGVAAAAFAVLVSDEPWAALALAPVQLFTLARLFGGTRFAIEHLSLWTASVASFLLLANGRWQLDAHWLPMAAWLCSETLNVFGFETYVEGATIVGLDGFVWVSQACVGLHVTAGAWCTAAIASSVFLSRGPSRWGVTLGFIVVSNGMNLARVVAIAATVGLYGLDAAHSTHDSLGYAVSLLLYAALAVFVWKLRGDTGPVVDVARRYRV